ncbi:3-keto-disaccharide hydrolase [Nafulsella turpanensis]|uniref:3-keto-disaccharide hydrolase n=1 Tax=Nafulsella turpanensis TaxID=1265690 RepID=UPI00058DB189|nr:DUF1080 domain-containing protein [Nafulsella turpanensis]
MKTINSLPLFLFLLMACSAPDAANSETDTIEMEETDNVPTGWTPLFNGNSLEGWHSWGKDSAGSAWKVEEGVLFLDASEDGYEGGDLVSNRSFGAFHLKLDWKISEGGNSGILFYAQEDSSRYDATWQSGPEMQILDNEGHPDGQIHKHRAGDLYDLIAASEEAAKPVGEWNEVEIISQNEQLEFFLNGKKIVSTSLWDESWRELIANSKFSEFPGFGTFKKGRIALQDHGNKVWFRNIRIKAL